MNHPYLKDEHDIFRKSLRKFLGKEAYPFYDQWEEERLIPRAFWTKMGDQGFLCPDLAETYGGYEVDWGYSVVINEELERVGSGLVGIGLHNDIVVPYINSFGTEEQKQRFLPKCVTGEYITAIAMTEPGAGSDLANIATTAVLQGDHYILNGAKTFITNGIYADYYIVAAKTNPELGNKGISIFLMDTGLKGISAVKLDKLGWRASDTAEIAFDNVEIPAANLMG